MGSGNESQSARHLTLFFSRHFFNLAVKNLPQERAEISTFEGRNEVKANMSLSILILNI